jgi:iron complex outermembrane receptor protein
VLDYELGVNYSSKKFSGQANIYWMDFDNEITLLGSLGAYSLQQFGNVEQSYRAGLEIDAIWDALPDLRIKYNGALSDNQIKDQGVTFEPLYTPKVVQNLAVNIHNKKVFVEIAGKHHSESYLDFANENVTPSFIIANVTVGYSTKKFEYKLKGINVLGEEYFTNGYMDGGVRHFYVNAPASVYLTVKYKL